MNAEILFNQNERLLYKQAWHYTRKYQLDFDDVKSEAFLIFTEALARFDDTRGAHFGTFLFHRLRGLNDYCLREKGIINRYSPPSGRERVIEPDPDDRIQFDQALDNLSEDGREIAQALFRGEFHAPELKRSRIPGHYRIHRIMCRGRGWTESRLADAISELKIWWESYNN